MVNKKKQENQAQGGDHYNRRQEKKFWEEKLEIEREKFRKEEEECYNGYKKCQEYIEEIKKSNKENVAENFEGVDGEAILLQSSDSVKFKEISFQDIGDRMVEQNKQLQKNNSDQIDNNQNNMKKKSEEQREQQQEEVSFQVVKQQSIHNPDLTKQIQPKRQSKQIQQSPIAKPKRVIPASPINTEQDQQKKRKQHQQQKQTEQKLRHLLKKQEQAQRIQKQQMKARLKILEQQKMMNQLMNMTLQDQLSSQYQKQSHVAKFVKLQSPLPKLPESGLKAIKQICMYMNRIQNEQKFKPLQVVQQDCREQCRIILKPFDLKSATEIFQPPEKIKARDERKKQRQLLQEKQERARLLRQKKQSFQLFIQKKSLNSSRQEKREIKFHGDPFEHLQASALHHIPGKLLTSSSSSSSSSSCKLPTPFNSKLLQNSSQIQSNLKFNSCKFKQSFNQESLYQYMPPKQTLLELRQRQKDYQKSLLKLAQQKSQKRKQSRKNNQLNLEIIKQMEDFQESFNNLSEAVQANSLASILPIYAKSTHSSIEIKTPYQISQVNGLSPYPVLKSLSLTSCKIMSLQAFSYQRLPYLEQLNFYQSKINHIPGQCFNGMANTLTSLNFELTNLNRIEPAISKLKNLRILNLSRTNQISKIENLDCLTKLQVLNLQVNRITLLEGLDNCTNLKILQLGNNKIQNVGGKKLLPLLTDLSLFKNQIQIWPVSNVNLYFLRSLTLSDNKLATFSLAGWSPFLETLNLSQNLIFSLNGLHLAQNIQQLDLSFNKINSPASLIKNLVWISGSLKKLKINDNPFWRDAAMVGESLAQIELSQQAELVHAERDMWKSLIIQIAPNIQEFNSARVINYV